MSSIAFSTKNIKVSKTKYNFERKSWNKIKKIIFNHKIIWNIIDYFVKSKKEVDKIAQNRYSIYKKVI